MKTAIPPQNIPFIDGRGYVSREWYLYLLNRDEKLGGKDGDTTIPDLSSEISAIETNIDSVESDIAAIEAVNTSQSAQIVALQADVAQGGADIADLQGDVSGLQTDKEDVDNKVSTWSLTTTNINYPSEKLTKDSLDEKQELLESGVNIKTINGETLLGAGDIVVVGSGGGGNSYFPGGW